MKRFIFMCCLTLLLAACDNSDSNTDGKQERLQNLEEGAQPKSEISNSNEIFQRKKECAEMRSVMEEQIKDKCLWPCDYWNIEKITYSESLNTCIYGWTLINETTNGVELQFFHIADALSNEYVVTGGTTSLQDGYLYKSTEFYEQNFKLYE